MHREDDALGDGACQPLLDPRQCGQRGVCGGATAPLHVQGYLANKKPPPRRTVQYVGLCLGPYESPRGGGVFL